MRIFVLRCALSSHTHNQRLSVITRLAKSAELRERNRKQIPTTEYVQEISCVKSHLVGVTQLGDECDARVSNHEYTKDETLPRKFQSVV